MWSLTLVLALSPLQDDAVRSGEAPREDERAAGHARMVATLAEVARQAAIDDVYMGSSEMEAHQERLAALAADERSKERWRLLCEIGTAQLRLGDSETAIASFTAAVDLHPHLADALEPHERDRAQLDLALAWMRLGETRNCVAHHTSESCILPIGPRGVHSDQEGSRKAIAILSDLLARSPDYMAARWLINVACMTVGEHPQGVPEAQRIGLERFASGEEFPRFVDVAGELGLDSTTLAGGVILDDLDGDDVIDVVASSMDPGGQLELFRGARDGTFADRTREAGLTGITGGLNIVQTDHDGDGFIDILVLRGAWLFEKGRIPNSLLHNDGDGTFTDVTFAAGLAEVSSPTQTGAWADYDNDGDLDLYVGNESSARIHAPSQLFRNEGGRFVDVARAAGVTNDRYAKGVAWGDYDGDRFPDLYVSNSDGKNRLYRNRRDGTFEDVAGALGVEAPHNSFATWFWDFDNDGVLDIYVASFLPRVGPWMKSLLGLPSEMEPAALYRGDGKGGFRDVAPAMGLGHGTMMTMGANFGDLDHDGFLDFYLGTGNPSYESLIPNRMFWNRGGKRFADVTTAGGFGHLQKGHGIAFADLDRDGDEDVFAEMGGAYPGDAYRNAVFRNPGSGNHWITVKLVGVRSNRPGIGARIRCVVSEDDKQRSIHRHVSSGGSFGASPLRQTIGLGRAAKIDVLEVDWPTSERTQVFRDVAVDVRVEITEGEERLRMLE